MEIYQVGGSVRDKLLGVDSKDLDWVVVGATADELLSKGFTQVGADFPVFLHPETKDEYALARTERKTGQGYLGFLVDTEDVTLEEDLMRRDLTINAMALAADGTLVDPFHGATDLKNKVLRHVSPSFAEDPVRILRVLRFLARFGPDWTVAPETRELVSQMVRDGEASALVPERVWKETEKALAEPHPHVYLAGMLEFALVTLPCFAIYRDVGANAPLLEMAAVNGLSFNARAALALGRTGQVKSCPPAVPLSTWKTVLAWSEFGSELRLLEPVADAPFAVTFLERIGAFKDDVLLQDLVSCWSCLNHDTAELASACSRALMVDTKAITAQLPAGPAVGAAIRNARIEAILTQP